jgi:hypothetical protein
MVEARLPCAERRSRSVDREDARGGRKIVGGRIVSGRSLVVAVAVLIFAVTLAWQLYLAARWRSHGAVGNDPTTYVQMSRDLLERGSPTHHFPLFQAIAGENLSWYAFITPGYRIVEQTGVVAPIFAFGTPLLLVFGRWLGGESGVYWVVPLIAIVSSTATFALGLEALSGWPKGERTLASALAVLLLATTPQQIAHAVVPMSDVPAQLFAVLALWFAFRAARRMAIAFAILCGATLGFGYLVRHTVVLMILPIAIIALARWGDTWRARIRLVALSAIAFGILIAPDIAYRVQALGGVAAVESPESQIAALQFIPLNAWRMATSMVSWRGFGPLAFVAAVGFIALLKTGERLVAAVFAAWIGAFVAFHLPLMLTSAFDNELRYLLPAYPALVLLIGAGLVWMASCLYRALRSRARRVTVIVLAIPVCLGVAVAFAFATRSILSPYRIVVNQTYGWLSPTARADFDTLATRLPDSAVVGASDQLAGAVLLFGRREVFLPSRLRAPAEEFPRFVDLMQKQGQRIFLLGDLDCLSATPDSERLPVWLRETAWTWRDTGFTIRDLRQGCAQRVYELDLSAAVAAISSTVDSSKPCWAHLSDAPNVATHAT